MKDKGTTVRLKTTFQYIQLLNGIFGLTDTEIKILAAFVDKKKELDKAGISINPFSTEIKKQIADKLNRDNFNTLNNYIKRMHDKGAIGKVSGGYRIHPILIPNHNDKKIVFKLEWINQT